MIDIFDSAAIVHDAGPFPAVAEVEGMPDLVNGLFGKAFIKVLMAADQGESFIEAVCGYDTGFSSQLRLPVNVGQDRDEEIHFGNGQDLNGMGWCQISQFFKDDGGEVLVTDGIKGEADIFQ